MHLLELLVEAQEMEELEEVLPQGVMHPVAAGPRLAASARENKCKNYTGVKIFGLIFNISFLA